MNSITISETYSHPKKDVFGAFSNPNKLAKWIAPFDDMPTDIRAYNFAPEGHYEIIFEIEGEKHHLEGQFLSINPHDNLSFSWIWQHPAPHAGVESLVEIILSEKNNQTKLTLTHSKLDASGMPERHKPGWQGSLTRLRNTLNGE